MQPLLYRDLVTWYRLLDPFEDHLDEAICYGDALQRGAVPAPQTLLEIGAGAGHNAYHLKRRFQCTLSDLSQQMQGLSRELNPECEHVLGDMRTLRLGRTFDAVLVHDAVMYMTTEQDLHAALTTAFVHTRPGGAAVVAPDHLRDTFRETTLTHAGDEATRSLRCLEWTWDPDPADDSCVADYAFLLRDGQNVTAVHDRHVVGLFTRATWLALLEGVGYRVEMIQRPIDEEGAVDEVFLCRRPADT